MFRVFEGSTADEVWAKAASAFRRGDGTDQSSRAGDTRELLHSAMSISNPIQRWVISRVPAINPAFAIAETIWIMTGRNDSAFLNYFNRRLPEYAGHGDTYHGAYGYRLRHHFGIDQIERAYQALNSKPHTRQVTLQIWDSRIDLPSPTGQEASPDIPCNVASILKVRRGRLEWMQILRSNDLYRGLPYNIVQFTTLQEILAGWLGIGVGEYNQISNSLHVYARDLPRIEKASLTGSLADVRNTDSLTLPKDESEKSFAQLSENVQTIIDQRISAEALMLNVRRVSLGQAFRNMLCVLSAEGSRRRGSVDIAREIMAECSNPVYKVLFDRWLDRVLGNSKPLSEQNDRVMV
ncbi:MAG: thymidylate synthase [Acidobacteriota bacterium]